MKLKMMLCLMWTRIERDKHRQLIRVEQETRNLLILRWSWALTTMINCLLLLILRCVRVYLVVKTDFKRTLENLEMLFGLCALHDNIVTGDMVLIVHQSCSKSRKVPWNFNLKLYSYAFLNQWESQGWTVHSFIYIIM